jgi:hypothetical protein
MKKLDYIVLESVNLYISGINEHVTEVTLRIDGVAEKKNLRFEVNELDVEKTPREKIEAEIKRISIDTSDFSYASRIAIRTKIEALELALTYLN